MPRHCLALFREDHGFCSLVDIDLLVLIFCMSEVPSATRAYVRMFDILWLGSRGLHP